MLLQWKCKANTVSPYERNFPHSSTAALLSWRHFHDFHWDSVGLNACGHAFTLPSILCKGRVIVWTWEAAHVLTFEHSIPSDGLIVGDCETLGKRGLPGGWSGRLRVIAWPWFWSCFCSVSVPPAASHWLLHLGAAPSCLPCQDEWEPWTRNQSLPSWVAPVQCLVTALRRLTKTEREEERDWWPLTYSKPSLLNQIWT